MASLPASNPRGQSRHRCGLHRRPVGKDSNPGPESSKCQNQTWRRRWPGVEIEFVKIYSSWSLIIVSIRNGAVLQSPSHESFRGVSNSVYVRRIDCTDTLPSYAL